MTAATAIKRRVCRCVHVQIAEHIFSGGVRAQTDRYHRLVCSRHTQEAKHKEPGKIAIIYCAVARESYKQTL